MHRTDDPAADYERWSNEMESLQEQLPFCDYCDHRIQDDYLYEIEGEVICEGCLNENFRREVEVDG